VGLAEKVVCDVVLLSGNHLVRIEPQRWQLKAHGKVDSAKVNKTILAPLLPNPTSRDVLFFGKHNLPVCFFLQESPSPICYPD